MSVIVTSVIIVGAIGIMAAIVLYVVSTKFHVDENPAIEAIESLLPGANCGGCGCNGCHDFAVKCATASSLDGLNCPGAGEEAMRQIASITGLDAGDSTQCVAVVKCNGSCDIRKTNAQYDGEQSCAIKASLGAAGDACPFGCLGCGDCVSSCKWGALSMNPVTGLPEVDNVRCTGCGACVKACPRHLIELRPKGPRGMRVWVACSNKDRGAEARKECPVACIGCGKCSRICPHGAISVEHNLAYIDPASCRLCLKCVDSCPTSAIHSVNFPIKKKTDE